MIHTLTDENYSLLCSYEPKEGLNESRVHFYTSMLTWFYWVFFSTVGGIAGSFLPFDTTGIDFALTALFVVILTEQLLAAKSRLPAILAAVSSVLCLVLFGADRFLLPSLLVTTALLTLFLRRKGDAVCR